MKIDMPTYDVESHGIKEKHSFGIGDERVMIQLLRKKLYSNPSRVICQEYMSNARDAHREVNKHNVPIEVKIPTELSPDLEIRDYGPGISPDRVANVFVNYGTSTKRETNGQTGGFGIGAKCAWSHDKIDQFGVITYIDGVERHYSCYIDETGVGEMALLSETKTDEENGTKVVIPVPKQEISTFVEWVRKTGQFWTPKPSIVGNPEGFWEDSNPKFQGKNWQISIGNKPVAVVDGIQYSIDPNSVKNGTTDKWEELTNVMNCSPFLFFKTGQITVSANREQLFYDEKTCNKIQEWCKTLLKDFKEQIKKEMKDLNSYWEANCWYAERIGKIPYYLQTHVAKIKWKGKYNLLDRVPVTKGGQLYKVHNDLKITRNGNGYYYNDNFSPRKDMIIFLNISELRCSKPRIRTLVDKYNIKHENIIIVNLLQKDDNDTVYEVQEWKQWRDTYLDTATVYLSSDVEKTAGKSNSSQKSFYRVAEISKGNFITDEWKKMVDVNPHSTAETGYYFTYNRDFVHVMGESFSHYDWKKYAHEMIKSTRYGEEKGVLFQEDVKILGVRESFENVFKSNGWKHIDEWITERLKYLTNGLTEQRISIIADWNSIHSEKKKSIYTYCDLHSYRGLESDPTIREISELFETLKNQKVPSEREIQLANSNCVIKWSGVTKNKKETLSSQLSKLQKQLFEKYPLLESIHDKYYTHWGTPKVPKNIKDEVALYIANKSGFKVEIQK